MNEGYIISDIWQLGAALLLLDVARIGRSGVVLASTATSRLLDLELGDVWLVAVGHRRHPLLLVLFVGAARLGYHWLAPIALLKIVGAVGHTSLG